MDEIEKTVRIRIDLEKYRKEKCVLCGAETQYLRSDHVDLRQHYVEGCGQLCPKCYREI